jgi:hypothetical protein
VPPEGVPPLPPTLVAPPDPVPAELPPDPPLLPEIPPMLAGASDPDAPSWRTVIADPPQLLPARTMAPATMRKRGNLQDGRI